MLTGIISALLAIFLPASAVMAATTPGRALVAAGAVTSAGQPVPGAVVRLYAWPSGQVLDSLRHGQAVPRTLLATTTASPSGAYSLSVPRATLRTVAVSSGNANLEVDAGTGSRFFTANTTQPKAASVDISSRSRALTDAPDYCTGWLFQHQLDRDWGTVGGTYIWPRATGATSTFSYTQGQSSTLGIGESGSGDYGTFGVAGTESVSSTGTVGFPGGAARDNWEWQSQWRTALYKDSCTGGQDFYQVRPNSWWGGSQIVDEAEAPTAKHCSEYLPGKGSYFATRNEAALTWTGSLGVVMPDVGFDASAQTGYSSGAQLTYSFVHATQTLQVCGTNAGPFQAWRTVVER
ncbi:MAG: hypothetical protein ACLP52_16815 [Streptosporangiaceae bacterium]